MHNTHGATHTQYDLEVMEVFKTSRHDEDKRYNKFSELHNRQLLWHGSRTTNFCGILSQVCVCVWGGGGGGVPRKQVAPFGLLCVGNFVQ